MFGVYLGGIVPVILVPFLFDFWVLFSLAVRSCICVCSSHDDNCELHSKNCFSPSLTSLSLVFVVQIS